MTTREFRRLAFTSNAYPSIIASDKLQKKGHWLVGYMVNFCVVYRHLGGHTFGRVFVVAATLRT